MGNQTEEIRKLQNDLKTVEDLFVKRGRKIKRLKKRIKKLEQIIISMEEDNYLSK